MTGSNHRDDRWQSRSTPRSAFLARLTLEPSRPRLIARGLAGGGGGPSRAAAHLSRRRMVRSAARAVGGRIGPRVASTRRRAVVTPRAPPRPPRRQARILVARRHQSRRQTPSGGPAICGTIRSRRSGYAWIRRARAGVCASRRSTTTPPPTTRLRASSRSSLARRSSVTVTRQVDPRRSVVTRSVFAEYSHRYAEGCACGLWRLRLRRTPTVGPRTRAARAVLRRRPVRLLSRSVYSQTAYFDMNFASYAYHMDATAAACGHSDSVGTDAYCTVVRARGAPPSPASQQVQSCRSRRTACRPRVCAGRAIGRARPRRA